MASSGVTVAQECITAFNDLKLGKKKQWIIFKISDNWKEIVVEETGDRVDNAEEDYKKVFVQKLRDAKSKNRKDEEGIGGRYAVYDVEYDEGNEGKRSKITFISWVPDEAAQYPRMMYSSSKEALKRALNGLAADVQANDPDDIEWESILSKVSKGR